MAPARDPVEAVAQIADARRDRLLRIHRRRLRWEDLEDCYSQATLELVARAKRDPFDSSEHIRNALEQKFSSRIDDRRRAIGGRSPIETAIATALPVEAPEAGARELEDPTAEVVGRVVARLELRRLREVADELTDDQRLVLTCQISLGMDCAEFCRRYGWSGEKFRKVAQRGRSRLRALVAEYEVGERCARLEPDLIAYAARAGTEEQTRRVGAHLSNCTACATRVRALDRASRQVAALLPAPVLARAGLLGKLGGLVVAVRRGLGVFGGGAETGAAGVAGGSAVGAGALKIGVAAACLAGAAGGYAICADAPHDAKPTHRPQKVAVARLAARSAGRDSEGNGQPGVVSVAAAVTRRSPVVASGSRLARGRLAAEVAEREFFGGAGRSADLVTERSATVGPSGAGGSAPVGSPVAAGSQTAGGSPGPTGQRAPTGTPTSTGTAGGTGSGPTGTPVSTASSVAGGSRGSGAGGSGTEAQSEFGGFEH
jgi:DNA-directed RNA polymerase specialized sigma24 family protein